MRWLVTLLVWVVSLALLLAASLFGVLVLVGPHSSLLPSSFRTPVLILGWSAPIVASVLIARFAWQRLGASDPTDAP